MDGSDPLRVDVVHCVYTTGPCFEPMHIHVQPPAFPDLVRLDSLWTPILDNSQHVAIEHIIATVCGRTVERAFMVGLCASLQ